ncbi:hypothetical protein Tco_0850874 [Tanacetum coccineum]
MESLNLHSQERELHQLQQTQDNAKESCMTSFQILSERAFMTLFGQDNETFTSTMFLYVDQLQNQLDKEEFQEDKSVAVFWVLNNQFQKFIDWQYFLDYDSEMTEKFFAEYTGIKKKGERETNIELATSKSFKDVHHLDTDAARPPCFDLSSFVKKIALLGQFEHGKIARYYGADKTRILMAGASKYIIAC